jgi:uncharacterized lipoprotein YbaY
MAIEEPRYRVVERDGSYELRDYAPYLLAETRVEAPFLDAGNVAFGRLFRYISGNNVARQKIAMTAPVTQAPANAGRSRGEKIAMTAPVNQVADGDAFLVGFVVPAKYTRESVPQPLDPAVKIREVPAQLTASWRYSGRWTEANFQAALVELRAVLKTHGLSIAGEPVIARYNPPFMPTFLRRNEVLVPVRRVAAGGAGGSVDPGAAAGAGAGAAAARENAAEARATAESLPKPAPLVMMGSLAYRARIALPAQAVALVELREITSGGAAASGRVVARQRIALEGRQVPVPFSVHVERGELSPASTHELRGGILVDGRPAWVSAPVKIDITVDRLDAGTLMMQTYRDEPFATDPSPP